MNTSTWAITPDLKALSSIHSYLKVNANSSVGSGWFTTPQLLEPGSSLLDDLLGQIMTARETTNRHYAAMAFINSYWLMIGAALGCYYLAERVPFLNADNLIFHMNTTHGYVDEVAFLTGRYYCLPTDLAVGDSCAVVVMDRQKLAATLREQLEAHLAPVIDLLNLHSTLGKRALWAAVADNAANIIITSTQLLGKPHLCEQEIDRFLHVTGSPLNGKCGAQWVEYQGVQKAFLKRGSCCLSYVLPANYGYCATCPLLSESDRINRLTAYMKRAE